jgi:hypothetical protein
VSIANIDGSDRPERRKVYRRTVRFPGEWRKFLPTDLTSPGWYDADALAALVFGYINRADRGGRDFTLRDFVKEFRGLSRNAVAKKVCDQFPDVKRLRDFVGREGELPSLLKKMKDAAKPPSANILGQDMLGHFRKCFERWYGVGRWWSKRITDMHFNIPFVIEVGLAETRDRPGRVFHAVNFSPTFNDPLAETSLSSPEFHVSGIRNFLERGHAGKVAVAFHLICPYLEFLDKGKTRLKVAYGIAQKIGEALWKVVKDLYKEEERRKKDAARQERADRQRIYQGLSEIANRQWSLKRAVFHVMRNAVDQACGSLGLVSAHTLYYHVRPLIQEFTSRELASDYFEQNLLPAYRREVGPLPEVYYEPRGTLHEPHGEKSIPLGTREVDNYTFPAWLYDKILFVEKKGLWPVLKASKLAERYDLAIVAGEGYATEACRVLFASAEKGKDYQLFVVHDADPHGYNIARTLQEETARMPEHRVKVFDLGLKLGTALELGLPTEEFTRRKALPQGLVLDAVEREHFGGRRTGTKSWVCRRVELNAFSGPDFITYIEEGLRACGVRGKVIPPDDILGSRLDLYLRIQVGNAVEEEWQERISKEKNRRAREFLEKIGDQSAGLCERVAESLKNDPEQNWERVIQDMAWLIFKNQGEKLA